MHNVSVKILSVSVKILSVANCLIFTGQSRQRQDRREEAEMAPDSESCTAVIMRTPPGKNSDHQRHALNGQFWATKGLGQGSSISCQLLCCKAGAGAGLGCRGRGRCAEKLGKLMKVN